MEPDPNLLVILNDNRMSISEAVGGLTKMLGRMSGNRTLNAIREGGTSWVTKLQPTGARFVKRWKNIGKACSCRPPCSNKWASTTPARLMATYRRPAGYPETLKGLKGPQLLHIITTKGRRSGRGRSNRLPRGCPV